MEYYVKKLQNFWFYHKIHLLIGLAAVLVICYTTGISAGSAKPDYHIGLVQTVPCTEEYLRELESEFAARGEDLNDDGQVLVQIHTYFTDLSDGTGANHTETVAALDADLIGALSGMFLLEDVSTFRSITNNLLSDVCIPFRDQLTLTIRRDAADAYRHLADAFS